MQSPVLPKNAYLPRGTAGPLALLLALGLAAGSVWDQPISAALYNPASLPGRFFAAFAEYPMALGMALAGGLLLAGRETGRGARSVLQGLGAALLLAGGVGVGIFLPARYGWVPLWAEVLLALAACGAAARWGYAAGRRLGPAGARRAAGAIVLLIALEYGAVTLLKELWSRPRYRFVALGSGAPFVPWWQPQTPWRALFTAAGTASEEFRSFPSGHTSNAALLLGLALLPRLEPRLAGRGRLLFWCGAAYAAAVALSRIVLGAHYLSDTVCGCALCLAALWIVTCWLTRKTPPAA